MTQAIDIWSFACVLSSAATWAVLDWPGIQQFEKLRENANRRIIAKAKDRATRVSDLDAGQPRQSHEQRLPSDQFHDGREVLPAVTEWHKYLRSCSRKTDHMTLMVLDLVDQRMLKTSPGERISASHLCEELEKILKSTTTPQEPRLSDDFRSLLGQFDEEESIYSTRNSHSRSKADVGHLSTQTARQDPPRRIKTHLPLTTTHRQSMWPNQNLRFQGGEYLENQGIDGRDKIKRPELPIRLLESRVEPQRQYLTNLGSNYVYKSAPGTPKKNIQFQNYFQACDALKKRGALKKRRSNLWDKFNGRKSEDLDSYLQAYFTSRRDIVRHSLVLQCVIILLTSYIDLPRGQC